MAAQRRLLPYNIRYEAVASRDATPLAPLLASLYRLLPYNIRCKAVASRDATLWFHYWGPYTASSLQHTRHRVIAKRLPTSSNNPTAAASKRAKQRATRSGYSSACVQNNRPGLPNTSSNSRLLTQKKAKKYE